MRNVCFKKGLVVGIIVLFLGVGFQPALANEVSITKISDNEDCGCQEINRVELLRVKLLLIRLETFTNILLSKLSQIPEVADNCREIFNKINSFKERINGLKLISSSEENSIICGILFIILIELIILVEVSYAFADIFLVNFPTLYEIFTTILVEVIVIAVIGGTLMFFATIFDCDFFSIP